MAHSRTWPFPPELVPACICSRRFLDKNVDKHRKKCRYGLYLKARRHCDQYGCWGRVSCRVCRCPAKARPFGLFQIGRDVQYAGFGYGYSGEIYSSRVVGLSGFTGYCIPELVRMDKHPERRRRSYWRRNEEESKIVRGTWQPYEIPANLLEQRHYYKLCEIPDIPLFVLHTIYQSADGRRVKHSNTIQSYTTSTRLVSKNPYTWENCIIPTTLPEDIVKVLPERLQKAYRDIHQWAADHALTA